MLNVLHVLQELSRPIKPEKIEIMAIFNEKVSPIMIKNDEPKLNCNKEKFVEWIGSLSKSTASKSLKFFRNFEINKINKRSEHN
jgi:hypothetical protein